jgi:hypothetical protein
VSRDIGYCILIVGAALVFVMAAAAPDSLSDTNLFLKAFVSGGLLDVLGVILAITLSSAGQLHLTLNEIEEKHNKLIFGRMRPTIRRATTALIVLFVIAVALVSAKPLLAQTAATQTIFNGFALFVLLWNVLLLVSLTQGIFAIKPEIK